MLECPNLVKCPFFNNRMASMPAVAEWMKQQYCRKDYDACARYLVAEALGSTLVPPDLFPNQKQRALDIIAKLP